MAPRSRRPRLDRLPHPLRGQIVSTSDERSDGRRGYIIPIGGAEEESRDPEILRRFVELCGGRDAYIAIIPTASRLPDTGRRYERVFSDIGARKAVTLGYEKRSDCKRDDWLEVLEDATGVFMCMPGPFRCSADGVEVTRRSNPASTGSDWRCSLFPRRCEHSWDCPKDKD